MRIGAEYSILDNHISFGLLSTTRFGGHRTYAEGMAAVNFRRPHACAARCHRHDL